MRKSRVFAFLLAALCVLTSSCVSKRKVVELSVVSADAVYSNMVLRAQHDFRVERGAKLVIGQNCVLEMSSAIINGSLIIRGTSDAPACIRVSKGGKEVRFVAIGRCSFEYCSIEAWPVGFFLICPGIRSVAMRSVSIDCLKGSISCYNLEMQNCRVTTKMSESSSPVDDSSGLTIDSRGVALISGCIIEGRCDMSDSQVILDASDFSSSYLVCRKASSVTGCRVTRGIIRGECLRFSGCIIGSRELRKGPWEYLCIGGQVIEIDRSVIDGHRIEFQAPKTASLFSTLVISEYFALSMGSVLDVQRSMLLSPPGVREAALMDGDFEVGNDIAYSWNRWPCRNVKLSVRGSYVDGDDSSIHMSCYDAVFRSGDGQFRYCKEGLSVSFSSVDVECLLYAIRRLRPSECKYGEIEEYVDECGRAMGLALDRIGEIGFDEVKSSLCR